MEFRSALELIWKAGIAQVEGHASVSAELAGDAKYDGIISVGKAATPMLEAALAHSGHDTKSLLVTKYGHVQCRHKFNDDKLKEYQGDGTLEIIEAGHPLPDENSLKAGLALRSFVSDMANSSRLLVLVSGGASALAELLPSDMSMDVLRNMNESMLAQGLDIGEINSRRRAVSLIKDGKLLAGFGGSRLRVMAISDVAGDDIALIGSGIGMTAHVDERVDVEADVIANNGDAREACAKKASMLGFEVISNTENIYGDVETVAGEISRQVITGKDGVYILGGEPTVVLPDNPGRGGRNQHLALLLGKHIAGKYGIEMLVAGSDGNDGPTSAAGGFADGGSFAMSDDAQDALARADAGSYLEVNELLFTCGPTGTNVMDMIVVIKQSS